MRKRKIPVATLIGGFFIALVTLAGCGASSPESIIVFSENNVTSMRMNETLQLTATVSPSSADQEVIWASSKPEIATISESGLITASSFDYSGVTFSATCKNHPSITQEMDITITAVTSDISSLRTATTGSEYTIAGVVSNFVYTGQGTPYITGMFVTDQTGSVYVFGEDTAKSVSLKNYVVIKGNKTYYIPETDSGSAPAVNYIGALQLTSPELLYTDKSTTNPIPEGGITTTYSLSGIINTPLSTDITGNIYRIKCRIRKVPGSGFTNYYIDDLNRLDTILCYTQSNGKDFAYLDSYDGESVFIIANIILGKPGTNSWRLYPSNIISNTVVSAEEEATYALERALKEFPASYGDSLEVTFSKTDTLLAGVTRSISCTSDHVAIVENADDYTLNFTVDTTTTCDISISATYDSVTKTGSKTITLGNKPAYTAITLAQAKAKSDGETVTVDAVVTRLVYKSGTDAATGAFIADDTATFFVYNGADYLNALEGVVEGNKIAFSGTITHYISNADNATANSYSGDFQIADMTLIYNDQVLHAIPTAAITESSIQAISETPATTNISGMTYKVTGKIIKTVSTYYSTYNIKDVTGTYSLNLYSQKNGSEFTWLDTHLDTEITLYLGVQNAKYSATSLSWRVCPVSIIA